MAETRVHDCFISHASEDKEAVARPLAIALAEEGYDVWYDEFELELGDSLPETINAGLAGSRFGVVVLSKRFFEKKWSTAELDALLGKQVIGGERIILPIWHEIDEEYLEKVSPMLAHLVGVPSAPLDVAVEKIARKIDRRRKQGSSGAALVAAQASKTSPPISDPERLVRDRSRVKLEYTEEERGLYRAGGGVKTGPGWLSVIVGPVNLEDDLVVAPGVSPDVLREIVIEDQWYSSALLNRHGLRSDLDGFSARFPEDPGEPPGYWLRMWQDGLMEFGESILLPGETDRRLPYVTLTEWTHDYTLLFTETLKTIGYRGELAALMVLGNVMGFGLGLPPGAYFHEYHPIEVDQVQSRPLRATVDEVPGALGAWLKQTMDRVFVAAGIATGAYFLSESGVIET